MGPAAGLRLVALKRTSDGKNRSSWIYRYRTRDKRLRQIKLGEYPTMSLADARKGWALQKGIRDDLAQGDPRVALESDTAAKKAALEEARRQRYTIKLLCEGYLTEHVEERRANQKEPPRRLLLREVIPVLGAKSAGKGKERRCS